MPRLVYDEMIAGVFKDFANVEIRYIMDLEKNIDDRFCVEPWYRRRADMFDPLGAGAKRAA